MTTDPYVRDHDRLHLTCLDAEARERTAGYWYTVTSRAVALTAFRTRDDLLEWAELRGVTFADEVPAEDGEHSVGIAINGEYRTASHRDVDAFAAITDFIVATPVLSNGEYTLGKITEDSGIRTVHHLNVNDRADVYPWGRGTDLETVRSYIAGGGS